MVQVKADKVAVVTGASRGIGAATAKLLALEKGYAPTTCMRCGECTASAEHDGAGRRACRYTVCVNYRSDAAAAAAVVDHIRAGGGHAVAMQADIGQEAQVRRMHVSIHTHTPSCLCRAVGLSCSLAPRLSAAGCER